MHSGETQSSKVVAAFNSVSIKGAICSYIIWKFRIELRLELLWFINSSRYALGIIKRDLFTKWMSQKIIAILILFGIKTKILLHRSIYQTSFNDFKFYKNLMQTDPTIGHPKCLLPSIQDFFVELIQPSISGHFLGRFCIKYFKLVVR